MKAKYDSSYPVKLNGIIGINEFQESIARINLAIPSEKWSIIIAIIPAISLVLGTVFLSYYRVALYTSSSEDNISPFLIVGIIATCFGAISLSVLSVITTHQCKKKMGQAIAQESLTYSTRTPIPCTWKLQRFGNKVSYFRDIFDWLDYSFQIAIDIGRPFNSRNEVGHSNQPANESRVSFNTQEHSTPRLYLNQFTGF